MAHAGTANDGATRSGRSRRPQRAGVDHRDGRVGSRKIVAHAGTAMMEQLGLAGAAFPGAAHC